MIKITTKTNTNWKQVKKDIKSKIIPEIMKEITEMGAFDTRQAIDISSSPNTDADFKELSNTTLMLRELGVYSENKWKRQVRGGNMIVPDIDRAEKKGLKPPVFANQPLLYTGTLRGSIKHETRGNKYFVKGIDYGLKHNEGYKVGATSVQSVFQGKGRNQIPGYHVPARDFIPNVSKGYSIFDEDKDDWNEVFTEEVQKSLSKGIAK